MSRNWQQRMVPEHVVTEIVCDGCGKRVSRPADAGRVWEPAGWHEFHSDHSDWGNDSIESSDGHAACSGECYLKVLRKVSDDYAKDGVPRWPTLKVDGMDWQFLQSLLAWLASASPSTGGGSSS